MNKYERLFVEMLTRGVEDCDAWEVMFIENPFSIHWLMDSIK